MNAAHCVQQVAVLSDEVVIAARDRLDPAAGVMLSAVWVTSTAELVLVIHHLAVDGVSWRILLDDLNTAWNQHHIGRPIMLPARGTSFHRWATLLSEYAQTVGVLDQLPAWQRIEQVAPVLPAVLPAVDTAERAQQCRCRWM